MDAILNNMVIPSVGTDPTVIQGATGAQYSAVDLTQFNKPIEEIQRTDKIQHELNHLTVALRNLITAIAEQHQTKQPVSSSSDDLFKTVDAVLEDADWLMSKLEDAMDNRYDMEDLISQGVADKVASEVENYFSYDFNIEDHCDIHDIVQDKVDSVIDGVVEEKLAEIIQDKLSSATITFN
jgi:archaellum component FlaC